ncbi:family 20 glycosylhydrolase [Flavitalea flava]
MYRLVLSVVGYFLFFCGSSNAQKNPQNPQAFDAGRLSVEWRFVKNFYELPPKAISTLTLTNKSDAEFPATGWKIYFNTNRAVDSKSVTGGVSILHKNGDLNCIAPLGNGSVLKKGDSMHIQFTWSDLTFNPSDVPNGFYLVWDKEPEKGYELNDFKMGPIVDDAAGFITAKQEYEQNARIKDMPAAGLPKIFPTPLSYKENGFEFLLNSGIPVITDPAFRNEAVYLADILAGLTGKRPEVIARAVTASDLEGATAALIAPGAPGSTTRSSVQNRKILLQWGGQPGGPALSSANGKPGNAGQSDTAAYQLMVNGSVILIRSTSSEGLFYGIQSLVSLIDPGVWAGQKNEIKISGVEVKDSPRFGYRSLMLDVARNFQTKNELMRVLDLMALYKLNILHLHFMDDEGWRLEIPSLPELTEIGSRRGHTLDSKKFLPPSFGSGPATDRTTGSGHYTRTEFIELLKYAKIRHIRIIPEIESPGHARAAIKAMDVRYENYSRKGNRSEAERYLLRDLGDKSVYEGPQMWNDNVLCVALPSVYRFFDKVVDEIALMYREAGASLTTIHLGGDEVPTGAWEKSPLCAKLLKSDPSLKETTDLWRYYYHKLDSSLKSRGLVLSGWEEIAMRKTMVGGKAGMVVDPSFLKAGSQVHVWNNMIGGGEEDLPYRLANAGFKVILSCVSNNYFDMAYQKTPGELGYHWGGYTDVNKPFDFIPFDYYKNSKEDYWGNPVVPGYFSGKVRLTEEGKKNILGVQGLLFAENLPTVARLEYMLLPKLLSTAERAWAADPSWATEKDSIRAGQLYQDAWSTFSNILGKRELPRLNYLNGGYAFRIPPAGAVLENGILYLNSPVPGFTIRYSADGSEPGPASKIYTTPVTEKGTFKIRVYDTKGRGGRIVTLENP